MSPRHLILVRHAKAEPYAATDHARDLTDRGRRQATALGEYLRATTTVPDHALVSTATRARATWELVAEASGTAAEVVYDEAVYTGSPDVVMDALRSVPPTALTVSFVGHNPTVGYLAHLFEDGTGDPAAFGSMMRGFPPGSAAVFEVEVAWTDLAEETGRLVAFRPGDV